MSRVFDSTQVSPNITLLTAPAAAAYSTLRAGTIAAWVKLTTGAAISGRVTCKTASDTQLTMSLSVLLSTGTIGGSLESDDDGSTLFTSQSSTTITPGTFTHILMSWDYDVGDKKIHIYKNGVEVSYSVQATLAGNPVSDLASSFFIGSRNSINASNGFNGNIAEVAVWNTKLSGAQITALAASTTGAAAVATLNLVAYWHICGLNSPEPEVVSGNSAVLSANPPIPGVDSPGFNCSTPAGSGQGNSPMGYVIFDYDESGNILSELQTGTLS